MSSVDKSVTSGMSKCKHIYIVHSYHITALLVI